MILTCPECATSYFVDDGAVGQGRTVRCTACSASWRAEPSPALELRNSPEEGAIGVAPAPPRDISLGALPASDVPRAIRARAQDQKKVREAATAGAVWAGIGAVFALVIGAAMVFRVDVVRVLPRTAGAYAAVGLPVNRVGLTIENIKAEPALQDGRAALAVSGVVRNIRTQPVEAPPLAIRMLDKQGHPVGGRELRIGDALVAPGQTRDFAVSLLDPPLAAKDVEVTFALDGWKPRASLGKRADDAHAGAAALTLRPAGDPSAVVPHVEAEDARPAPLPAPAR